MATSIRSTQATGVGEVDLSALDAAATPGVKDKDKAGSFVESLGDGLRENQLKLLAGQHHAVLLVLQGMDACGKDGVVKHVIDLFYPTSVSVRAFKAPTDEEKRHDFLWRYRQQLPAPGTIAVFNRSWYEDVGIVKVHQLAEPEVIEARYAQINAFEDELAGRGISLIKCFLHISYEEQAQRMLDRLNDPTKRWKFKTADLDERDYWADYMKVYSEAISRCGTHANPWYVVPADHKWYRDWVIAQLLAETLDDLKLHYPDRADLDIAALTERIKASRRVEDR
jgi:PPK2 family polyphosphate:nucleotide phosphotransferase